MTYHGFRLLMYLPTRCRPEEAANRHHYKSLLGGMGFVKDMKPKRLNRIAFLGNYLPRRCGIATFTTDLCEAIAQEYPETACVALPVEGATILDLMAK